MVNQQLLDYIKLCLGKNISKEEIKSRLLSKGWNPQIIEEAFIAAAPIQPRITTFPSVKNQIKEALNLYKERFAVLLAISSLPLIVTFILTSLGNWLVIYPLFKQGKDTNTLQNFSNFGSPFFVTIAIIILVTIITALVFTWSQMALYSAVSNPQKLPFKEALRKGWRKIIPFWWTTFISGIIIFGGSVFLIIPGIIFSLWFSMGTFIVISEDLKGMAALLKSREYVRGKTMRVLWRLLALALIAFVSYLPILLVIKLIPIKLLQSIVDTSFSLLVMPFFASYAFLIYRYLKEIKGDFVFSPTVKQKVVFILVGVIGVLTSITSSIYFFSTIFRTLNSPQTMAKDLRRQTDLMQIERGLELYRIDKNSYPFTINQLIPSYLPELPFDPSTNLPYKYTVSQGGQSYKVCATMENKKEKCVEKPSLPKITNLDELTFQENSKLIPLHPAILSVENQNGQHVLKWLGTGSDIIRQYDVSWKAVGERDWHLLASVKPTGDNKGNYEFIDATRRASPFIYGIVAIDVYGNKSAVSESSALIP